VRRAFPGPKECKNGGFEFHKFGEYCSSVLQAKERCFEYWVRDNFDRRTDDRVRLGVQGADYRSRIRLLGEADKKVPQKGGVIFDCVAVNEQNRPDRILDSWF